MKNAVRKKASPCRGLFSSSASPRPSTSTVGR